MATQTRLDLLNLHGRIAEALGKEHSKTIDVPVRPYPGMTVLDAYYGPWNLKVKLFEHGGGDLWLSDSISSVRTDQRSESSSVMAYHIRHEYARDQAQLLDSWGIPLASLVASVLKGQFNDRVEMLESPNGLNIVNVPADEMPDEKDLFSFYQRHFQDYMRDGSRPVLSPRPSEGD